jgi:hypothetical protein
MKLFFKHGFKQALENVLEVTIKSLGLSKTIGVDIEILERTHKES